MGLMQHVSRAIAPSAVILIVAAAVVSCSGKSATDRTSATSGTSLAPQSWKVPVDVANATASPGPTQADWSNFGWQTFTALNWPAAAPSPAPSPSASPGGVSGLPDETLTIGAASANQAMIPTVWLTYRTDANTMLAGAQNPGAWASPPNPVPCGMPPASPYPVSPGFNPMILNMADKFNNVNEATDAPQIDQNGWFVTYDIRLNMSEYTYIQQNGYYNAANQEAAFSPSPAATFVGFPKSGTESMFNPALPADAQFGALEVKAAWRVLNPSTDKAVIPRYYTQSGYFIQGDGTCSPPTLFGLIGLHILRLTPTTGATWYWATFEQVDNVTAPPGSPAPPATLATPGTPNGNCTPQYNVPPPPVGGNIPWNSQNTPVNVCRVTNISPAVAQINQTWQSNLAGTVWANYELVDTINPSTPGETPYPIAISSGTVNTNTLANTSMETYFQGTGQSCMTCHQSGFPQGAPNTSQYQIFTFVLGDAVTPPPAGSKLLTHAGPAHRPNRLPRAVLDVIHKALKRHP